MIELHVSRAHVFQHDLTGPLLHSAGGRRSTDIALESEVTAYQLLLLMTSGVSRQEVLWPMQDASLCSHHVSNALRLHSAFAMQDGLAFLAILREAPHLLQCLAHQHAAAMRCLALEQLAEAFPPSRTSLHLSHPPSDLLLLLPCLLFPWRSGRSYIFFSSLLFWILQKACK